MRVRMMIGISGGRGDGTPWPRAGGELDVDDDEGAALCAGRLAIPVPTSEPVETPEAPLEASAETRGRPIVNAPKADWEAYAASQGADPAEAAAMSKVDLLTRYGPNSGS